MKRFHFAFLDGAHTYFDVKNEFIEIANSLLFKSVELSIIDDKKKFESAKKKAEKVREDLFKKYVKDGKKNWDKNKSHFKESYIFDDITICKKLVSDK